MVVFQVFIKFWSSERNTENAMSHLYLNEERDYPEENTCENKNLSLQHSPQKEMKHIHATAPCLLHTILE